MCTGKFPSTVAETAQAETSDLELCKEPHLGKGEKKRTKERKTTYLSKVKEKMTNLLCQ